MRSRAIRISSCVCLVAELVVYASTIIQVEPQWVAAADLLSAFTIPYDSHKSCSKQLPNVRIMCKCAILPQAFALALGVMFPPGHQRQ